MPGDNEGSCEQKFRDPNIWWSVEREGVGRSECQDALTLDPRISTGGNGGNRAFISVLSVFSCSGLGHSSCEHRAKAPMQNSPAMNPIKHLPSSRAGWTRSRLVLNHRGLNALVLLALAAFLSTAKAATSQPGEFLACKTWSERVFSGGQAAPSAAFLKLVNPFCLSFLCQGTNSTALLAKWACSVGERKFDSQDTLRELAYSDPATGLEVRIEAIRFSDFPVVEWVAHFTNRGSNNTPLPG
jgi:hypothetical protein